MNSFSFYLALSSLMLAATPALAQSHAGHAHSTAPVTQSEKPAADAKADPHAGHDMGAPTQDSKPGDDPHAGHNMPSASTASADPHAGHNMGTSTGADPHAGHDMGTMRGGPNIPTSVDAVGGRLIETTPPAAAFAQPAHAADLMFDPAVMAAARKQLLLENGGMRVTGVFIDALEARFSDGEEAYGWKAQGWTGGDINRFWWKTEGEGAFGGSPKEGEIQALYSRAVAPFWNVQTGVRQDFRRGGEDTTHAAVGVEGLAPYWFEVAAFAYLSTKGDLTAHIEAEYDQRITQKWILQPSVEMALSASNIPELSLGSGVTSVSAGLGIRYEIRKELAPYVGVKWKRALGGTADYATARGEDPDSTTIVVGLKAWF